MAAPLPSRASRAGFASSSWIGPPTKPPPPKPNQNMPNHYEYKKFVVLYVDDEEKSLVNFTRAFGDDFQILTASNAADGFKLIEARGGEIGLLDRKSTRLNSSHLGNSY